MSIATIPADLRNRTDLTLEKVNRVVYLRKRREVLKKQRVAAAAKVEAIDGDIAATEKEESELVTAPAPLFADQP